MTKIYILLGGNLGNKEKIFSEARINLNNLIGNLPSMKPNRGVLSQLIYSGIRYSKLRPVFLRKKFSGKHRKRSLNWDVSENQTNTIHASLILIFCFSEKQPLNYKILSFPTREFRNENLF